jgi:hypothetical protein
VVTVNGTKSNDSAFGRCVLRGLGEDHLESWSVSTSRIHILSLIQEAACNLDQSHICSLISVHGQSEHFFIWEIHSLGKGYKDSGQASRAIGDVHIA